MTPNPNITGLFLPSVHCNLSWLDVKGAFVTCQVGTSVKDQTIDFEEFLTCLALCGTIKYENLKGLGSLGRPPNMAIGLLDDAGDPTPAEAADCPLAVIVDGIYVRVAEAELNANGHRGCPVAETPCLAAPLLRPF